ncbi:6-bladed beta-propeller [Chloroflexota bacterium]
MRDFFINIMDMPTWIKITVVIIIIIAILTAGVFLYLTNRPVEWDEQPVMLRLLKGEVLIRSTQGGDVISDTDNTWLNSGNFIEVGEDSAVLLQYFDSSMVKIKGPAEIIITRSQSVRGDDLSHGRAISLNVLYGRASILAAQYDDKQHSVFEVVAPNSVAVVEGTIFVVSIDRDIGTVWQACEGVIRVGTFTGDSKKDTVMLLTPLSPFEALLIPAVLIESHPEITEDEVLLITRDMTQISSVEQRSEITLKKVALIEKDDDIDFAVYGLIGLTIPASISSMPEIPFGYEILDYEIITSGRYSVILARSTSRFEPFFPFLQVPDIWKTDQPDIEGPPVYISSIMGIDGPLGIAVDPQGDHICVTQSEGNRNTLVFDEDGNHIMTLAPPHTSSTERAPSYVAVDWNGTIYVSDRLRHTIDMYDEQSNYLGTFTPKNNPDISWSPLGLATDMNGNLYITDVMDTRHRVIVCNSDGEQILEFGQSGTGPGSFSFPNDITVDDAGRIFVSDSNNQRIQVFSSAGTPLPEYTHSGGGELSLPRGIDCIGKYVFVADTFDHRIKVYDITRQMTPVLVFGGFGTDNGLFSYPNGIAVDRQNRIYVADRDNNRIQILGYGLNQK